MSPPEDNPTDWIEWSVAARPIAGQAISGDMHLVRPFAGGALIAAVDGLGHGKEATLAAQTAISVLDQHPHEFLIPLVKRCHEALLKTRGAVMTVATLNATDGSLAWLGVGNVEGRLLRANGNARPPHESVLLRSGLVGFTLPPLYASMDSLSPGDLLIMATDGISANFDTETYSGAKPAQITEHILNRYFKGTDDALVLAVRYHGKPNAAGSS